jgi:thymidine kinase
MKQSFTDAGKIEVICGCMFSGKTEELIRRIRRAQIAKLSVIVFKPFIDSRYSANEIVSHNNIKIESHSLKSSMEIKSYSLDFDVIGIDEAQFFDDQIVDVCKRLADKKIRVIVAGLDTDYRGKPFGFMPQLMCESDYLDKLRAICVICGNPASYTQRTISNSKQVLIGETDMYEARCRNCFELPVND